MISKKLLLIPLLMTLVACGNGKVKDKYEPNLTYEKEHHKVDDGFVMDGVLNEPEYASKKHFQGKKVSGEEWATIDWSMYFGNEGVYMGFDVTENTAIYVNPFRATFINSGLELYLFPTTATTYATPYTLEIDLVADGTLLVKRNIGSSTYGTCEIEDANNPYLVTTRKESVQNEYGETINGYIHEFFMPYTFFQRLGFVDKDEKINEFHADIVHIASKNYEGNNSGVDRNYYSFAAKQLDAGVAWTKPQRTYLFNKDVGFVCYDINLDVEGPGEAYEIHGYSFAVPQNSAVFTIKPNGKRVANIKTATVNGVDVVSSIGKTYEEGVYELRINYTLVTGDLNIKIVFN